MPAQYVTSIVEGQDFYISDIDPTGVVSAPRGSVCLRTDNGNALIYYNVTVGGSPAVGTTWVPLLSTDLTDITQILLADNANPALQIGSLGYLDLLKFITTNGAERVVVNATNAAMQIAGLNGLNFTDAFATITGTSNVLLDVGANGASRTSAPSRVGALVTATYAVPANSSGGNVDTNYVLSNPRNMQVFDAFVISGGAATGSVQLRTTTGSITDAMVPTATLNGITRMGVWATNLLAPGATLVVRAANNTLAAQVRVVYEVLS